MEDCLTNARKLLAVDIHSDFRTFVAHKVSYSIGCKTFLLSLSADSSSELVLVDVRCELVEVALDGSCELDVQIRFVVLHRLRLSPWACASSLLANHAASSIRLCFSFLYPCGLSFPCVDRER